MSLGNSVKVENLIEKQANKNAAIFIQNLMCLLSSNGKKINVEDLKEAYDTLFYAEIEHLKLAGGQN